MSATQGSYRSAQFLLDMTQGARVASSVYSEASPALSLRQVGSGAVVEGWREARKRAEGVPQLLQPGLLAGYVPGGGAYVGVAGASDLDAAVAADRGGRISEISLGSAATLTARIAAVARSRQLVVADLPGGGEGIADSGSPMRAEANCCGPRSGGSPAAEGGC
jgi:hypothetical protein